MEQSFMYYGKQPDPDRKLIRTGEPIKKEEFAEQELSAFRSVFSDEVRKTVRGSAGLFRAGAYENLSPQHGAFERLLEAMEGSQFELVKITRTSYAKDEAMFRVQIRVPVIPVYYKELFKEQIPQDAQGYVFASFYTGVCKDFLQLSKKNALMEELDAAIRRASITELPTPVNDPAFDPERVIPSFLKQMRLDRRYHYMELAENGVLSPKRYYQAPEGFIYHVEIDGYAALAS